MDIAPLQWPEKWTQQTNVQKALKGLPFLGLDRQVKRELNRELEARPEECLSLWGTIPDIIRIRDIVSPVLQEYFFWPNLRFIPGDPCQILFWDQTNQMRDAEALAVLSDRLNTAVNAFDNLQFQTYQELIDAILQPA